MAKTNSAHDSNAAANSDGREVVATNNPTGGEPLPPPNSTVENIRAASLRAAALRAAKAAGSAGNATAAAAAAAGSATAAATDAQNFRDEDEEEEDLAEENTKEEDEDAGGDDEDTEDDEEEDDDDEDEDDEEEDEDDDEDDEDDEEPPSSGCSGGFVAGIVILAIVLVAVLLCLLYRRYRAATPANQPTIVNNSIAFKNGGAHLIKVPVTRGILAQAPAVTATGNLKARSEISVGSEISGIITEVKVDSNDTVRMGQPIAFIDRARLEQDVKNKRATLDAAKAKLALAEATVTETGQVLVKNQLTFTATSGQTPSKLEMEASTAANKRAISNRLAAEEAVKEADARFKIAETDLSKTIIRSPVNGVVLKKSVEAGQTVAARYQAPELFVIAEDLKKMKLVVNIAQADVASVAADSPAKFVVDAVPGRQFSAKVVKVESAATLVNNVVTYEAELEVPNDDLALRVGMTAVAEIYPAAIGAAATALQIPNAALNYTPKNITVTPATPPAGQSRVWLWRGDKLVHADIRTGNTDSQRTIVIAGDIHEGDLIVTGEK